jgi:ribonuclease P protein component
MRKGPLRSLTRRRDFEVVFQQGVSSASRYIVMYSKPNELIVSRFGLSVSKKVGNAVVRNRLKRLLREAMKKGLEGLALHYDFVIIARRSSVDAGLDDFIRDIKRFLSRLLHEKDSDITYKTL